MRALGDLGLGDADGVEAADEAGLGNRRLVGDAAERFAGMGLKKGNE